MATIRELLARRSDLSTFIVHLTRATTGSARSALDGILNDHRVRARTPMGSAVAALQQRGLHDCTESQQVVCFTETPLEHLDLLVQPISDLPRTCAFEAYGIAFTKRIARLKGVNPVWYVDITPGHDWLMGPVNELVVQAADAVVARRTAGDPRAHFLNYPISHIAPFVEQMGTGTGYRKEFWWEREWRHAGDFLLPEPFIVIAPEAEHASIRTLVSTKWKIEPPMLDAKWGLEEIIGRLAGFSNAQIRVL